MSQKPRSDAPRAPRRVGRPALISRDAIVDAVLEIGLDKTTTSAVAARLGVDQSTLYGHIANREDMLDAAADAAIGRSAWPEPATVSWREYLLACADALWELFRDTPGLAAHLRAMTSVPAALTLRATATIRQLLDFGFDLPLAALAVDTVGDIIADSYLIGETLHNAPGAAVETSGSRAQLEASIDAAAELAGEIGAGYAAIIRDAIGSPDNPSTWWREKVLLVLDGVGARLDAR